MRKSPALAAHDLAELGVGLELDEAEDDVDARLFQIAGDLQIRFLVEPRLDLDQRGDDLAGLSRFLQRLDDRRFAARAVERPFDRQDIRIGRRLPQILQHDVEGFVRVMDDQVLLLDGGKAIAAEFADALGKADHEGLELQVGPLIDDELGDIGERQQAVLDRDRLGVDLQFPNARSDAANPASTPRLRAGSHCRAGASSAPPRRSAPDPRPFR